MRFSSSVGAFRPHSVFGTTPKNVPPSQRYRAGWTCVISKSPTIIRRRLALHQLASALEQVGCIVDHFAAALGQFLAGFHEGLAGLAHRFFALIGGIFAGVLPRLGP